MSTPLDEIGQETAALLRALAKERGLSVDDYLRTLLPNGTGQNGSAKSLPTVSDEERQKANARLRQHIVSLGYATGADNESIDADLAREYGGRHAPNAER